MHVFISHASTDSEIARKVAEYLADAGMEVWDPTRVLPGDNWAAQAADALEHADAMVVLLTPDSLRSHTVKHELQYALGNEQYEGRLVSVRAASLEDVPEEEIPWILKEFPIIDAPDVEDNPEALKKVAEFLKAA